jgi:hypothetical protein
VPPRGGAGASPAELTRHRATDLLQRGGVVASVAGEHHPSGTEGDIAVGKRLRERRIDRRCQVPDTVHIGQHGTVLRHDGVELVLDPWEDLPELREDPQDVHVRAPDQRPTSSDPPGQALVPAGTGTVVMRP